MNVFGMCLGPMFSLVNALLARCWMVGLKPAAFSMNKSLVIASKKKSARISLKIAFIFMGSPFFGLEFLEAECMHLSESMCKWRRGGANGWGKGRANRGAKDEWREGWRGEWRGENGRENQKMDLAFSNLIILFKSAALKMSSITQNSHVCCKWCLHKCTSHGGGLTNHHQWSQDCWRSQQEEQLQLDARHSPLPDISTPTMEGTSDLPNLYDSGGIGSRGARTQTASLKTLMDTKAGKPLPAKTLWEKIISQQDHGKPYLPFKSKEEWELAHWCSTEGFLREQLITS